MSWTIIIIVIIAGLALVALEIVALPGAICGIVGGLTVIVGIWQSYANYGTTAGIITLLCSIAVLVIMMAILIKSGTWKRFSLKESSDGKTNQVDTSSIHVGSQGLCISRLAPAGKAQFGDEITEVHSLGEFIDQNSRIEVVDIEGYRIIVKKID